VPHATRLEIERVLSDPSGLFRGHYPPVPALPCGVLSGLAQELADPEVLRTFQRLGRDRWPGVTDYAPALAELRDHHRVYALVAATTHFSPDVRIGALEALLEELPRRASYCTVRPEYERLHAADGAATRFFRATLASTPHTIPGSENATIHDRYIHTLRRTLDALTEQTRRVEAQAVSNAPTNAR
jgi:hypothetical protein